MKTKVIIGLLFLLVGFWFLEGKSTSADRTTPSDNYPMQNTGVPILTIPSLEEKAGDVPVPVEKKKVTSSADQVVQWETYRNEEYSYEVKYPKGWNIIEAKPRVGDKAENYINILVDKEVQKVTLLERGHIEACQGAFQIVVISNPEKLTSEQRINKENDDDSIQGISDTTLDRKPAKKLSIFGFDHEGISIIVSYMIYIYSINFYGNAPCDPETERHQQIYQQMVSTFRFIE